MSWLDDLGPAQMVFPEGETVVRERRLPIPDPYNPSKMAPGSWDGPLDVLPLESCFVDFASSNGSTDATRSPVSTTKALFCTDPDVDVQVGDRIRAGSELFYLRSSPAGYRHPWTGWRPPLEIPLDLEEG